MAKLMFHVRHNARPGLVKEVLRILDVDGVSTLDDILTIGNQRGYQIGTIIQSKKSIKENLIQTATDFGLIAPSSLSFTNYGQQMVNLLEYKPSVFNEVMHILHYTLWQQERETEYCFSWSYRILCDLLWESGSYYIDQGQLVSQVSELAMNKFNTNEVSFSKDSVRGILNWLSELYPRVLEDKKFTRRQFCPPETFILTVDYLYHTEGADYQTNLLLDQDKQESICKACLLEPTAFSTAFDWAVGQFDFLQRGTSGGWGSYILLSRQPEISDFLG